MFFAGKREIFIHDYKCLLSNENTKIYDGYKLKSKKEIEALVEFIIKERQKYGLRISRTRGSYIREIKAHIRLYKMGLFRSHTKDTDLEEPILRRIELIYLIIGI